MKKIYLPLLIIVLTALALLMTTGCDKRTIDKDQFFIAELHVPDVVYNDTPTEVRALVREKKTMLAAANQTVTFKTDKGTIETNAETNSMGIATVIFEHSITDSTETNISASIDKDTKIKPVQLRNKSESYIIEFMNLPTSIYYQQMVEIKVRVKDMDSLLVVDKPVKFNSQHGIIQANVQTNNSGIAIAEYIHYQTTDKLDTITAKVDSAQASALVNLQKNPDMYTIAELSALPPVVYIDGNNSFSTIRALVVDEDNYPVAQTAQKVVRFKAVNSSGMNIGQITATSLTDENGIATAYFYEGSIAVDTEVTIVAEVDRDEATISVNVEMPPDITSIQFLSPTDGYEAILNEEVPIIVEAFVAEDQWPPDGTIITISKTSGQPGTFEDGLDSVSVPTVDGKAHALLILGTRVGETDIRASSGTLPPDQQPSITINTFSTEPPARIALQPQIQVEEGSNEYTDLNVPIDIDETRNVRIRAIIKDEFNNNIEEIRPVFFESNIGVIDAVATTGSDGIAYADFNPGVSAGLAEITASVYLTGADEPISGVTVVRIVSYDVSSVRFTEEEELIGLDVTGTGGNENHQVRMELRDVNGNLVSGTGMHRVRFAILNSAEIDATVFPSEVWANNGIAIATVSSGTTTGVVVLRGSFVPTHYDEDGNLIYDEENKISATRSNIVVRAGFPADISLFIGENQQAQSFPHNQWQVDAGAVIKDIHNNPVIDQTAVFFELEQAHPSAINPDFEPINISGEGFTGNENYDGESAPGYAFTLITYHGTLSYRYIKLVATTATYDTDTLEPIQMRKEKILKLPLRDPTITMVAQPMVAQFSMENPISWSEDIIVYVSLRDGQSSEVTGDPGFIVDGITYPPTAVIRLRSDFGKYVDRSLILPITGLPLEHWIEQDWAGWTWSNNPVPVIEGPLFVQTVNGETSTPLRLFSYDALPPPDPMIPYQDTPVSITAHLLGTDAGGQTDAIMRKFWETPPARGSEDK